MDQYSLYCTRSTVAWLPDNCTRLVDSLQQTGDAYKFATIKRYNISISLNTVAWWYTADPAVAVRCPFHDAYYFNYKDAVHEMCKQPLSYAKPCVGATTYQLHFKHCQPTASLHAKGSLLHTSVPRWSAAKYIRPTRMIGLLPCDEEIM